MRLWTFEARKAAGAEAVSIFGLWRQAPRKNRCTKGCCCQRRMNDAYDAVAHISKRTRRSQRASRKQRAREWR
jgi:hypothetical protein